MAIYWRTRSHALMPLVMIHLWAGCAGQTSIQERRYGEVLAILKPGVEDIENKYSSVVALTRSDSKEERPYCSGVLIDPRLVLTAAHCVCKDNLSDDGSTSVLDQSTCKSQASISTILYRQVSPKRGDVLERYTGEVLAHPRFKIVLKKELVVNPGSNVDGSSPVKSLWLVDERSADIALIRLSRAVADGISYASLSKGAAGKGAEITITGFGADEINASGECVYNDSQLTRRFGGNKIVEQDPDAKTFVVERPETLAACGDSGGGGFLRNELIGILSANEPGKRSTYTNVGYYRKWIEEEIEKIRATRSH